MLLGSKRNLFYTMKPSVCRKLKFQPLRFSFSPFSWGIGHRAFVDTPVSGYWRPGWFVLLGGSRPPVSSVRQVVCVSKHVAHVSPPICPCVHPLLVACLRLSGLHRELQQHGRGGAERQERYWSSSLSSACQSWCLTSSLVKARRL